MQRGRLRKNARSLASLFPDDVGGRVFRAGCLTGLDRGFWATAGTTRASRSGCAVPPERRECRAAVMGATDEAPVTVPATLIVPGTAIFRGAFPLPGAAEPGTAEPGTRNRTRNQEPRNRRSASLGTLVHRLLQRQEDPAADDETVASRSPDLLTPDERVDVVDVTGLSLAAARTYRAFRLRPDVKALLESGACYFEVPFSFEPPDRPGDIVRGVVDCLIVSPDGSATVLEFKTGEAQPGASGAGVALRRGHGRAPWTDGCGRQCPLFLRNSVFLAAVRLRYGIHFGRAETAAGVLRSHSACSRVRDGVEFVPHVSELRKFREFSRQDPPDASLAGRRRAVAATLGRRSSRFG